MTVDTRVVSREECQSAASPVLAIVDSEGLPQEAAATANETKADQRQRQQGQRQQSLTTSESLGSRNVCRICHMDSWPKDSLISPCRCKGTLAHVHLSCLERWLNQSSRNYCELCNFRYNALETPRYRWFEALRIWINHPRNRRNIRADILIFTFLTVFTAGLSSVCLLGSHYLFPKKARVGFSEAWTKGAITLFMIIVILGYLTSIYLLIRNQATPWYRWWRGAVNIRLLLDSSTLAPSEVEMQQHERNDLDDEHR
ncbi:PREDICTED: E3 ubiquitin-protein ligase MARCH3-like [Ceratosolen solmsi marchali]|uniref:E3 ubiquitin-protein ligase MARCH3-like n=1 Tax=Ceratosolen solmsi marchali TaxID=326594 RepID=A0AAJ7E319_9HYME|nr:PREDICTED: E3 ubiquitin-protein ligase MARCH3-like [Ceratosolen solmsi marchali]